MRRSLLSCLCLLLCSALLVAQASLGQLRGIVRDPAGFVLPGAEVSLLLGITAVQRTLSDGNGRFAFRELQPGRYTIVVRLAGFRAFSTQAFVTGAVTRDIEAVLSVGGGLEESVTVTGNAPVVERRSVGRAFNTEAYDKIDDNDWSKASSKPLSTFSIDVDTASYANVRRFLNQGTLPPKDAVRIEEFINYFTYDYPEPTGRDPFSLTTAIGNCPWNPAHRLALIGLQGRRLDRTHTPPRNLVFLVDVSGSMMDPRKLPLVKTSLALLARNLTEADRIGLVVYAGAAGVVLPSTPGGDSTAVLDALARLEAGGSTNGAQGIVRAYEMARQNFITGGVNRVVLATDGDFNVGVTNQGDLVRLIEEQRESGVTLSVLGFGMGNLKDSTMEKLADRGNGNYSYIDSVTEAQKVLVDDAAATLVTIAKDVKLQVEFNPRVVASYRLVGYENRMLEDRDFNDDAKDAGDMGAGHSVTALYELILTGRGEDNGSDVDPLKYQESRRPSAAARRDEVMTVKVRYKAPDGIVSSLTSAIVRSQSVELSSLNFAAAVAEFGMVLRDSPFKGSSSFAGARLLATRFKGDDRHGHRAEFIRLIDTAEQLSRGDRRD